MSWAAVRERTANRTSGRWRARGDAGEAPRRRELAAEEHRRARRNGQRQQCSPSAAGTCSLRPQPHSAMAGLAEDRDRWNGEEDGEVRPGSPPQKHAGDGGGRPPSRTGKDDDEATRGGASRSHGGESCGEATAAVPLNTQPPSPACGPGQRRRRRRSWRRRSPLVPSRGGEDDALPGDVPVGDDAKVRRR